LSENVGTGGIKIDETNRAGVDGAGFDLAIPARDKGDAIPPVKDIGLEAPVSVNKVAKLYSKEKGWSCRLNQLRVFIGRVLFSHLPLRIICREHLREGADEICGTRGQLMHLPS
jgi:hypothetical protein